MNTRLSAIRPRWFLSAGLAVCLLHFGLPSYAQRVVTGSAWQSETQTNAIIPAGTTVNIRTEKPINANTSNGRVFNGVVDRDVFGRGGRLVIPHGANAELIVRRISDNTVVLDLDSIVINGERYGVQSTARAVSSDNKEGIGANERTGKFAGGGAVLGAIVGGIAGGGTGAAIGAGAGAAGGLGAQLMTRGSRIDVPAESLVTFRLTEPLQAGISDDGYTQYGDHYHRGDGNAAYEQGLQDGQADAQQNLPQRADRHPYRDSRERSDYEAGYNDGYQQFNQPEYGREKPGYPSSAGSPWSINILPNQNITWQAPDHAKVYVQSDNGQWTLFASGQSGTSNAPWMTPGHIYTFVLQDQNGNEVARAVQDLR